MPEFAPGSPLAATPSPVTAPDATAAQPGVASLGQAVSQPLLKYQDVARILNVSQRTVFTLAEEGQLKRRKVRGQIRFRPADVQAYIEQIAVP